MISMALIGVLTFPLEQAAADLERIEVLDRKLVGNGNSFGKVGPYEQLRGRLYFAVEPNAQKNQNIVDITLVARDARGHVHFAADFLLLRPIDPTRGNNRMLYEPANLGEASILTLFNDAAKTNSLSKSIEYGNGFLMEQGYTLLWTGWSWDLTHSDERLRADLPIATTDGKTIYGRVTNEIIVRKKVKSARQFPRLSVGYAPLRTNDLDARLLVRDSAFGENRIISRDQWRFGHMVNGRLIYDPAFITLDTGFDPGSIYTVTYFARSPHVSGLGLAGIRDALLFFRSRRTDDHNTPNPILVSGGTFPRAIIAVGNGQSAHALQTMIHYGLTSAERGRLAFDGALLNSIVSRRGNINTRFSQPARAPSGDLDIDSPSFLFPFAATTQTDPVTGENGSSFDNMGKPLPKLFYVNTTTDYWTRGASLIHTDVDGSKDLKTQPSTRLFMIPGGRLEYTHDERQQDLSNCSTTLNNRPILRALLIQLDAWVTLDSEPAPSVIPSHATTTLGNLQVYLKKFPNVPRTRTPAQFFKPRRLNFGKRFTMQGVADVKPPQLGRAYTSLVPIPDVDGTDTGGIPLPGIAVPLGTYTGWNLANASTGAPDRLDGSGGSFIPFPRNEDERLTDKDPRISIKERYPSRKIYRESYATAAHALAEKGFLLNMDINPMIDRAERLYDQIMTHNPANETCF